MRDKRDELSETENRFAKQMREFTDDRSIQYERAKKGMSALP